MSGVTKLTSDLEVLVVCHSSSNLVHVTPKSQTGISIEVRGLTGLHKYRLGSYE